MRTKHTPGPWIDWNDEEDNWLLVQEDTQQVIALFPKGDDESTKDQSLANCQLCAAAPELLAALKATQSWMEDCLCDRQHKGLPARTAYDAVCAAIAKAEGKSHE